MSAAYYWMQERFPVWWQLSLAKTGRFLGISKPPDRE